MATAQFKIPREVKPAIYDEIRKQFSKPINSKSKITWAEKFVQQLFQDALQNPNGDNAKMLARNFLQDDILSNLDAQTERLLARDIGFAQYRVITNCFDKQRNVILDTQYTRKIVMTSRRAGKTSMTARQMVWACCQPNVPCLYIHLKFESAIKQCFDQCIEVANICELGIIRESKVDGTIEFTNGSSITFKGNSDKTQADKLRGGKYKVIIVDEAAFQVNMKYLVEDICLPMLADFTGSQMVLVSTPPRVPHTYFEECWLNTDEWKHYTWNAADNPFIPNFKEFMYSICTAKGIDLNNPFIQREFLGKLVYDTEAQVYKDTKYYKEIPKDFIPTDLAIGVDYGFSDYNSMAALIYNRKKAEGYVIETRKFNKSDVTTIVEVAREIYNNSLKRCIQLNPKFELNHAFFYADTNEQAISLEMSTKYKLPVTNAMKYDKALGIATLADMLRTGRIQIQEDDKILKNEIEQTIYKRDEQDNILPEIDDSNFHPDCLDALLYASRQFVYDCNLVEDPIKQKDTTETIIGTVNNIRANTLPDFIKGDIEEEE